jgi:hypothetical protein
VADPSFGGSAVSFQFDRSVRTISTIAVQGHKTNITWVAMESFLKEHMSDRPLQQSLRETESFPARH